MEDEKAQMFSDVCPNWYVMGLDSRSRHKRSFSQLPNLAVVLTAIFTARYTERAVWGCQYLAVKMSADTEGVSD
jgi:hypothetical protein